jgi:phenylalanyl-tRNA synthetase beta chain
MNFVRKSAGEMLRDLKIFDVYTGKGIDSGRKSIAMGLILQHPSRTLVDTEVEEVIQIVITGLKKEFSAVLRE